MPQSPHFRRGPLRPQEFFQPLAPLSGTVYITPSTASLTLATFTPALAIAVKPATATLVLTGSVPVIAKGIVPAKASLTLITFAPSLAIKLSPAKASLILATFAPTLTITANVQVVPAAASLVLTGFAPVVTGDVVIVVVPPEVPIPQTGEFGHVVSDTGRRLRFPLSPADGSLPVTVTPAVAHLKLHTFAPAVTVAEGALDTTEAYMALYVSGALSDEELALLVAA